MVGYVSPTTRRIILEREEEMKISERKITIKTNHTRNVAIQTHIISNNILLNS